MAGDILYGYLYNLVKTMLKDRKVDNGFAEWLTESCRTYENSKYISLLEDSH